MYLRRAARARRAAAPPGSGLAQIFVLLRYFLGHVRANQRGVGVVILKKSAEMEAEDKNGGDDEGSHGDQDEPSHIEPASSERSASRPRRRATPPNRVSFEMDVRHLVGTRSMKSSMKIEAMRLSMP